MAISWSQYVPVLNMNWIHIEYSKLPAEHTDSFILEQTTYNMNGDLHMWRIKGLGFSVQCRYHYPSNTTSC